MVLRVVAIDDPSDSKVETENGDTGCVDMGFVKELRILNLRVAFWLTGLLGKGLVNRAI